MKIASSIAETQGIHAVVSAKCKWNLQAILQIRKTASNRKWFYPDNVKYTI